MVGSRCQGHIGIEGIVVQETQNTFKLINDKDKMLSMLIVDSDQIWIFYEFLKLLKNFLQSDNTFLFFAASKIYRNFNFILFFL